MKEILRRIKKIDNLLLVRQTSNAIDNYNKTKIHEKQMLFHQCQKKNRWVFGGNRSGKTECGAVESVWIARGIHPYRENKKSTSGWVVSLTFEVQRDVAQNKVLHYLKKEWIDTIIMREGKTDSPENGIIDYILVKNIFGTLSKIGFKSCDQGRSKFQGTSLDYVWFDEEPPEEIYTECRMRVLDREGIIFGTMTPLKGLTWVYDKIYLNSSNDEQVWCEFMEWADNPYLSQDEIKNLTSSLSADELESRRFGHFKSSGGIVYCEFDENINVIEPFNVPNEWFDTISIDPGLHNPLSAHWYAVDFDGNVFVIAEHYLSNQTVEYHSGKIKEICQRLNWKKSYSGMIECLIDSAATQKTLSSSKSVAELFYDNGILCNTKVNKDLYSGINRVKSYFKNANGETKLFIFKTCPNLIREIKGYFWGNEDCPVKKDDHALDELRYYIMSKPENLVPAINIKTDIQKDKERLIRQIKNKRNYF